MQLKEPPINRATIEAVAQLIAERFDPVQVILFGSHARGNAGSHSDIDLLVVLDSLEDWPKDLNPIRAAIAEQFILPVDVLVTTPARLAQQRDDPYSFYNTALESKVILYARPAPPKDWFKKADQDLKMAYRAMDPEDPISGDGLLPRPTMCRKVSQRLPRRPQHPFSACPRSCVPYAGLQKVRTGL